MLGKRNKTKVKISITLAIILCSSVPLMAFTVMSVASQSASLYFDVEQEDPVVIDDVEQEGTGFYDGIGQIYDAMTEDDVIIKVFRYHAPGGAFNDGAQPVLFFPGLCCNINYFMPYSTPFIKEEYDVPLPDDLASWAEGDEKIDEDPMLYYSFAYYLWKMGYDPWLANYRGIGYGEMRSEGGNGKTCMDHFSMYDVRAAVEKVNEITGLHPAIGGHSTGGLSCMMYLHGTEFNECGHAWSVDALVDERNGIIDGPQTVAGFFGIDPAMIPIIPDLLDSNLIWALLSTDLVLELGKLLSTISDIKVLDLLMDGLFSLILNDEWMGDDLKTFLKDVVNLDNTNMDMFLWDYFLTYSVDKLYFRTLSQYLDWYANQCAREFWKNGDLNWLRFKPPSPKPCCDSYYYYTENMEKIQVPLFCFLADSEGDILDLVDADQITEDLIDAKTPNENDECHSIASAHIDIGVGIRNPKDMFPLLGSWLAKI